MDGAGDHGHGGYLSDFIRMGDDPPGNAYGFLSQTTKHITPPNGGHHAHGVHGANVDHLHGFGTGTESATHVHGATVPAHMTDAGGGAGTASMSISKSDPEDAGQAHENMPPFYVMTYIIKKA